MRFPPVLALQLGGAQPPQGAEHLAPQQCQELKGDKVVAGLLPIAEEPPDQAAQQQPGEQGSQGQAPQAQHLQQGAAAQHGEERRAQVARKPQEDRQKHGARQGPHQPDEPGHHRKTRALHAVSSSP